MKNSPGRKSRRNLFFENKRRQGDLNRKSTHAMRTSMGMSNPVPAPVSRQAVLGERRAVRQGWWQQVLAWIKSKIRRA